LQWLINKKKVEIPQVHVIRVNNVNQALAEGLIFLDRYGVEESSRNGPVLVASAPVTTEYSKPAERVLFSPLRDANPFFHLFESLWMLAGRNDIAFPVAFNSRFGAYSDDGKTQRGAYGFRWRKWFGYDQLNVIINELRSNPASRRCVLGMWDAGEICYPERDCSKYEPSTDGDLLANTVDKPCNTHIYFRVHCGNTKEPVLDMTVCCRSNDILWGAYGANAVHFSFLQEYMAARIGVGVGTYYQMSNNFHLYTDVIGRDKMHGIIEDCMQTNYYRGNLQTVPLAHNPDEFDYDLHRFFGSLDIPNRTTYTNLFFTQVAGPMYEAWKYRKIDTYHADIAVSAIQDGAWRLACAAWLERRRVSAKPV
jgi:hypothetical protein